MRVTIEEIEAAKTPKGGWTYEQLRAWGLPTPPPKGWKDMLTRGRPLEHVSDQDLLDEASSRGWVMVAVSRSVS